jgi:Clustered mitochondria
MLTVATVEVTVAQRRLVDEFTSNATVLAKRIISEMFLPDHRKTIKPVDAGGIAGGLKFIEQGTFFKFALDVFNIYDGDGNAAKAAGHEINGLMNLLRVCQLRAIFSESTRADTLLLGKLHFPLMAVVRYRGYSMICTSLVPISGQSLIYGSDDGGKTVHADVDEVNRLVEVCATRLNLKGHWVGFNEKKFLHLPGDIEVWCGVVAW